MIFSASVYADLYWESEQTTKGMPGMSDSTVIIKNYITENISMTDMGEQVTIMDYKDGVSYQLDRTKKNYAKVELKQMGQMPQMEGGEDAQMFEAMMQSMIDSMKVTATNETKTISGYKCKKYIMSFMMANTIYWVSKDVKGYDEMKQISEKNMKWFESNPMMKRMNVVGLMKEIDGFPVQTISEVMGGTTTVTLKKIEKKKLDEKIFLVPKDYKLVQPE